MKIPHDFDVVNKAAPSADAGTLPQDNPGIKPNVIEQTPGEKARGSMTEFSQSKAQPFKKKGTGYVG